MSPRKRKRGYAGAKPVYLVVEHKAQEPSHSIVLPGTTTPPVTIPLRLAKRGMSFALVDSRWIVGVGGDYHCHFTIFDLTTCTESEGPWLSTKKVNPILIPHRDTLYVLSSRPNIDRGVEFLPWFEAIFFRNGRVPASKTFVSDELTPPPIFPYCINPLEYLNPPDVRVAAYAVVGSHILLSVSCKQQAQEDDEEKGTCAFDMDRRVWEMVDGKSLPFVGQAIPLGDNLFLARPKERDGAAAVYRMALLPGEDTPPTRKTQLSILELPPNRHIVPGQHLCALGMDRFSSFDVPSVDHGLEKARVIQRIYSLVKGADSSTIPKVLKWQRQHIQLLDQLVAVLAVDSK